MARAADLIILAPTHALGPAVERDRVLEPNWILWPSAREELVRLLPLTTGVDWNLRTDDFAVREWGGGFALIQSADLERRGFFGAQKALFGSRRLVPLPRTGGALAREAIALCADGSRPVFPAAQADLRDPRALIVAVAPTGDAIVRARRAVSGRVLLIETPPAGRDWSRFYLYGPGWPAESSPVVNGVPGLVPAREAGRLLARPGEFVWTPSAPLLYREADRWLAPARSGGATWGLVLLALGAGAAALFELARDHRTLATTLWAWAALAFPLAVLRSPAVASGIGPELSILAVGVILTPLVGAAWVFSRLWGERTAVAFLGIVGVLAAGWAEPFHPWSGVLRDLPRGLSPEETGATSLYAAVAISATREGEGVLWLLARLATLAALAGLLLRYPAVSFAIPLGWAAGMSWLPPSAFSALVTLPSGFVRLLHHGFDYRPADLARSYPLEAAANLWHLTAFLSAWSTLVFGFAIAFAAMTASSYTGYRLRRAAKGPGRAALVAALGLAATCVLTPELWPGVLVALAGGLPLLVADAR